MVVAVVTKNVAKRDCSLYILHIVTGVYPFMDQVLRYLVTSCTSHIRQVELCKSRKDQCNIFVLNQRDRNQLGNSYLQIPLSSSERYDNWKNCVCN